MREPAWYATQGMDISRTATKSCRLNQALNHAQTANSRPLARFRAHWISWLRRARCALKKKAPRLGEASIGTYSVTNIRVHTSLIVIENKQVPGFETKTGRPK